MSSTGSPSEILDDALTIYFPGPRSYTGEDTVELHVHGGRAVINAVLRSIPAYAEHSPDDHEGCRPSVRHAEPGEFTMRAFSNSRLDLTQVEGVGGMIDAETEAQRVAAVSSAGGHMRRMYNRWQASLLDIAALMAAVIDFSEEGYFENDDVNEDGLFLEAKDSVDQLLTDVRAHVDQIERSEIVLSGVKLALLGPPNAGKSSLLNALARRDAAIVSSQPGTTRDVVELGLELGGYRVVLADTAGLRPTTSADEIEAQGILRAREKSAEADVLVVVVPAVVEVPEWHDVVRDAVHSALARETPVVVAVNKCDLLKTDENKIEEIVQRYAVELSVPSANVFAISCRKSLGFASFTQHLSATFTNLSNLGSDPPVGASQRTKEILSRETVPALERFIEAANRDDVVQASEEVRYAADCLGRVTGESMNVEDVLGVVFSKFCVGK